MNTGRRFPSREAWLSARSAVPYRIGASEAAAILGVSPFEDATEWAVWSRKQAEARGEPYDGHRSKSQRHALEEGAALEPFVRWKYERETGRPVLAGDEWLLYEHERLNWLVGSPDGLLQSHPVHGSGGWEGKTDHDGWSWGTSGTVIERWEDGSEMVVPPWYAVQCYLYLEITGRDYWDISVLMITRRLEHRVFRLLRDEPHQGLIVRALTRWRDQYLVGGEEPEFDGSRANIAYLRKKHLVDPKKERRTATDEEAELVLELVEHRRLRKAHEEQARVLEARLVDLMGSTYGIYLGDVIALNIQSTNQIRIFGG